MTQSAMSAETRAQLSYLNAQRRHVLANLEGLTDEELRRSVLPSGWTCLALIKHLAFDIERFWFRAVVAGGPIPMNVTPDENWVVAADVPAVAIFDAYRQEIALADAIIAATSPDALPAWWPEELFGDYRLHEVRQIVLHVIAETAAHAGELNIVRELIDGKQWLVLT